MQNVSDLPDDPLQGGQSTGEGQIVEIFIGGDFLKRILLSNEEWVASWEAGSGQLFKIQISWRATAPSASLAFPSAVHTYMYSFVKKKN